jgi:NADPH:quinone reductase-like Zn-dependent oxidoreductase
MKAVYLTKFGGSEVLTVGEVPRQENLGVSDVRIRISYTAVNPVDWKIREGYLASMMPHEFPLSVGWEVERPVWPS